MVEAGRVPAWVRDVTRPGLPADADDVAVDETCAALDVGVSDGGRWGGRARDESPNGTQTQNCDRCDLTHVVSPQKLI